ncbi:hypothetical protein PanWU01x14_279210 [Parasponia andersonii]|uniref:Uncharacterized protein n=1 Tax=Parasponia andersonii TaxID=3476 RepID=A0A2P5B1Z7_PARAD|nr:hypothetical protein PanWU01x14_279210 [Parasponia andersonii]
MKNYQELLLKALVLEQITMCCQSRLAIYILRLTLRENFSVEGRVSLHNSSSRP